MQDAEKKFLNFPLCLLSKTITEETGMNSIIDFSIVDYAKHCKPESARWALAQLLYAVDRRPDEALPRELSSLAVRSDLHGLTDECFRADGFVDTAVDVLAEVELDDDDEEALTRWWSTRAAAHFFGYTVNGWGEIWREHESLQREVAKHERNHGPIVYCSIPLDYAKEAVKEPGELPMLRMVAAARSIVGRKPYAWTVKDVVRARMIGAKTTVVAAVMVKQSKALKAEWMRMQSRLRFDNLITDAACRGFFEKVGMMRKLWLSTDARSPGELKDMVVASAQRKARRDLRKRKEREARRATA